MRLTDCIDMTSPMTTSTQTPIVIAVFLLLFALSTSVAADAGLLQAAPSQ